MRVWKINRPLETSILYKIELPSVGAAISSHVADWRPAIVIVDFFNGACSALCNAVKSAMEHVAIYCISIEGFHHIFPAFLKKNQEHLC